VNPVESLGTRPSPYFEEQYHYRQDEMSIRDVWMKENFSQMSDVVFVHELQALAKIKQEKSGMEAIQPLETESWPPRIHLDSGKEGS
jgi:hypothetical protein